MKPGFLEKLIGRLGRIGPEDVQNYLLRLAQEKGFLETIFNAIQEGIIVTDSNGRITYLNDAACEIFGLDGEHAIGTDLRQSLLTRMQVAREPRELTNRELHRGQHTAGTDRAPKSDFLSVNYTRSL